MNRLYAKAALSGWLGGLFVSLVMVLLANKVVLDQVFVLSVPQWFATLPFTVPRVLLICLMPVTVAVAAVLFVPLLSRTQFHRLAGALLFACVCAGAALLLNPPHAVVTVVHVMPGQENTSAPQTETWPSFGPAYLPAIDSFVAALFGMLLAAAPVRRP